MTAMETALAAAGVPLPSPKMRIWQRVRESPGVTSSELRRKLSGIPGGTIGSALADMEARGMVYSRLTTDGRTKKYFSDMQAYSLLPYANAPRPLAPPTEKPLDKTTHETTKGFDIDSLTIAEARALYQRLHKMFGESK